MSAEALAVEADRMIHREVMPNGLTIITERMNHIRSVSMDFNYGTGFGVVSAPAYERLVGDAMRGDATLFTRNDEIEAQWRICDPIVKFWASTSQGLAHYEAGSQGPEEAAQLLRESHRWRAI